MTHNITCPACRMPVAAPAGSGSHRSAEGPVRYLRCLCGRWLVVLAGQPIATTSRSDFAERAVTAAVR